MKYVFETGSVEQTEKFAEKLGSRLMGGECIEFVSDIGGGKTTFVRGLAKGAGSSDAVSSPTFTISQRYSTDSFTMHHFDFYRLAEPGLVAEELAEVIADKHAVVIVEWAETVNDMLPKERVVISIEKDGNNDKKRMYTIVTADSLDYLLDDTGEEQ